MHSLIPLFLSLSLPAQATGSADPAAVQARLGEIQSLRSQRVAKRPPSIPSSAWSEAAEGKVVTGIEKVEGHKAKIGWGVTVLDVPIATMWRALNEELHHSALIGLDHVEITQGKPCVNPRQVMMVLPLPLVADRWWVVQNTENFALSKATTGRVRELAWDGLDDMAGAPLSAAAREAIDGAVPVAFTTGAWMLVDLNGRQTLGEYHAWSDPGGDLPAGPSSRFASGTIAGTLEKLEQYAKTATAQCPVR